jgi:glycosyltransferase involved in cell wall biosynthesis
MDRDLNLVSVIIPCYNHGSYLGEAIQSILDQTYQHFEIIVVDDGSTEPHTIEVLRQIRTRATTVYHKANGHLSSARNYGIKKSRGGLILTLDSDDRFAPSFIEKAVTLLHRDPRLGVVTCHVKRFGSTRDAPFLPQGGSVKDFLVQNNSCGNALFRHQCWLDAGGYREDLRGFEDWDFWIGVTKKGWLVQVIPEFLFFYRDTPGSMLKTVEDRRPELSRQIVTHHVDVYRQHIVPVLYQKDVEIRHLKNKVREMKQARQATLSRKTRRAVKKPIKWACRLLQKR